MAVFSSLSKKEKKKNIATLICTRKLPTSTYSKKEGFSPEKQSNFNQKHCVYLDIFGGKKFDRKILTIYSSHKNYF